MKYLPSQTRLQKRVGIGIFNLGSYPQLHDVTQDCRGYPFEHVQAIATLRDRGDGKTRWVITGSQDYYGWMVVLEADGSPPIEAVPGQPAPGRVLWATWYNSSNPAGIYNRPGDVNIVGDTLVVALQNWEGDVSGCRLDRDDGRAEDAVGFYDLSNPMNPVYRGKLTATAIFGSSRVIDGTRFFMAAPGYYVLTVQGLEDDLTLLSRTSPLPDIRTWERSGTSISYLVADSGNFLGPGKEYLTASVWLALRTPFVTLGQVSMYDTEQGGFSPMSYSVPNNWGGPGFNWVGDFNGDGLDDIASAVNTTVYLKLSSGSGFTQTNYTVPGDWGSSGFNWVGDFNDDGLADIASAVFTNLYLKINTGDGFTQTNYIVLGNWGSPGLNWVGNFNGDGRADIASADGTNVYLKLYHGGGFTETNYTVPQARWNTSGDFNWAGDFNGDGLTDLATATTGRVWLNYNTGAGFTEAGYWAGVWAGSGCNQVGDFNGDGKDDIISNSKVGPAHITYNQYSSQDERPRFTWFNQRPDGDLELGWPQHSVLESTAGLPFGWTNRTTQPGWAVVSPNEPQRFFRLQRTAADVTGFIQSAYSVNYFGGVSSPHQFAGDFNGDGRADFVVANENTVYVHSSMKGPTVKTVPTSGWRFDFVTRFCDNCGYDVHTSPFDPLERRTRVVGPSVVANHLGQPMVTCVNPAASPYFLLETVLVLTNAFEAKTAYYPARVPPNWGSAGFNWAGDFDGDGLADIASAINNQVYLKRNKGAGFTQTIYTVPPDWGSPGFNWVGDFNNDGWADIASAVNNLVYLKLNTGNGFTQTNYMVPNNWGSPGFNWVGDFDNDGWADIASANNDRVYLKMNNGTNGGFTEVTHRVPNHWNPGYTWAGDFNGDGRTDFLVGSGSGAFIKFKTATGFDEVEAFRQQLSSYWGSGGTYAWVGDFDGDGRDDIARAIDGNVYIDGVIDW